MTSASYLTKSSKKDTNGGELTTVFSWKPGLYPTGVCFWEKVMIVLHNLLAKAT